MKPIEKSDNTNIRRPRHDIVKKNQEREEDKRVGRKYTNEQKNKQTPKDIRTTSEKTAANTRLKHLGVKQPTDNGDGEIRDADKQKILNTWDYLLNNSRWLAPNGSTSYPHNPQDLESTSQAFTTGATNTASAILTAMGASAGLGNLARGIVGGVAGSEIAPLISDNKYASLYGGLVGGIMGGGYKPAIRFIEGRLNPETGLAYAMNDALETTPAVLKSQPNTEQVLPIETRTTRYIRPSRGTWNGNESIINEATSVELRNNPHAGYFELIDDIDLKTGKPNNEHSVHFKTDRSKMSNAEKMALFRSLEEQIPEGHFVSTHGTLSPGGVHGLQRFGTDFNYDYYRDRSGLLKYPPKYFRTGFFVDPRSYIAEIDIPVWRKPSKFHKLQQHVLDWINATDASTKNLRKFKYANDPNLYQKQKVWTPYFFNEPTISAFTDSHKFHTVTGQLEFPDGTRISANVPLHHRGIGIFENLSELPETLLDVPSWQIREDAILKQVAGSVRSFYCNRVAYSQKPFVDPTQSFKAGKFVIFGKNVIYVGKDGEAHYVPRTREIFNNKQQ